MPFYVLPEETFLKTPIILLGRVWIMCSSSRKDCRYLDKVDITLGEGAFGWRLASSIFSSATTDMFSAHTSDVCHAATFPASDACPANLGGPETQKQLPSVINKRVHNLANTTLLCQ